MDHGLGVGLSVLSRKILREKTAGKLDLHHDGYYGPAKTKDGPGPAGPEAPDGRFKTQVSGSTTIIKK